MCEVLWCDRAWKDDGALPVALTHGERELGNQGACTIAISNG